MDKVVKGQYVTTGPEPYKIKGQYVTTGPEPYKICTKAFHTNEA